MHARARYIFQLDSDNLVEPTAIEKCYWFLESHPEYGFVKGHTVGFGATEYLWTRGFHSGRMFLAENQVDATSMILKSVYEAVGGYDAAIRDGLEDWDFWLRCANAGFWGATIPEFLDWYRRRASHGERWADWDGGPRQEAFRRRLRRRYPRLWRGGFPAILPQSQTENATVPEVLPVFNRLVKTRRRLVMIVPWLTMGGADKFNLDLVRELSLHGWEVTLATTLPGEHAWLPQFARWTPDIFVLNHFLRLVDFPRFLRYLIVSRQADAVLVSHSEIGYMLVPYLRAHCPDVTFLDYCHIEEDYWKNGAATLHVTFRDTQYILAVFLQLLLFLTPVFYEASRVPARYEAVYHLNPMLYLLDAYRAILVRGEVPDGPSLLALAVLSGALLAVGSRTFARASHDFVDEL